MQPQLLTKKRKSGRVCEVEPQVCLFYKICPSLTTCQTTHGTYTSQNIKELN